MPSRLPRQVSLMVTTEACERFSDYGMLSVLTLYLKNDLTLDVDDAESAVHVFKMAAYLLPLVAAGLFAVLARHVGPAPATSPEAG